MAATAAFALALAAPAAASAATVGYEGDTLVFRAGPGEDNFVVAYADAPGTLKFTESATPSDGRCTNYPDWDYVECATPAAVRVDLGDRDDSFGLGSDFPAGMPLEVYGGDGKDDINGYGVSNGQLIDGGAGDDKLDGHEGDDVVRGGPGNDEVIGSAGNDVVEGGDGNDTLNPGPGQDQVFGDATGDLCGYYYCRIPFGNDVIDTRDGEQDTVDCGAGADRLAADAIDVVAANCEQVDKSGPGPGGPGAGGPDKPGGLTGPSSYSRRALKPGIAFQHTCAEACAVAVKLVGDRKTARKLGGKTIAAGKGSRAAGGPIKVKARLKPAAKRRLGRLRKGRATLEVTVVDGGRAQRFAKVVKLKR